MPGSGRLLIAACLLASAAPAGRAEPPKLNVVLIVADDLGWADLGCTGSKYHRTPNLDKLAAAGVRFTQAYAACPVCSPSRVAILTGKYPQRFGVTDWLPGKPDSPALKVARPPLATELPLAAVTAAEAFKAAGYATAHVGKWHLGGAGFGPLEQGFDVNVAGNYSGSPLSYFAPFVRGKNTMPGLADAPAGEYLTDRLTAEADAFISANAARPFFLYLAHFAPHIPLAAKPDVLAKYTNKPAHGSQSNPVYAAMLETLDAGVGTLLAKLETLKIADRTVVVFTSDNGGLATLEGGPFAATSNAPLREGKGYLYEGGVRVPLLVRAPGLAPRVADTQASSQDLLPTLCELCAVPAPANLDGLSLAGPLRGQAAAAREALYWHYPHYANQGGRPGGAVRLGDMKLIEFYDTGRRELFDLKADRGESRNLAADKPAVVKQLAAKLAAWRSQVGGLMPMPNPKYRPSPPAADGTITLPGRLVDVTGTQLRFEPLPHKNCLGYWTNAADTATWSFTTTGPGTFTVDIAQGCGGGNGGSEVDVEIDAAKLSFVVEDTGGFQAFKTRTIGTVTLAEAGRHTLTLRPKTKAKAAVMDVREVVLRPAK